MRSRNIKPGFFKNEDLAAVPPLGRLLFVGLWGVADREGRLEDRPKRLKIEVLPYDDCDPERLLVELAARGFIVRYNGYIQVSKFKPHQSPHPHEKASVIPPPTTEEIKASLDEAVKCNGNIVTSNVKQQPCHADSLLLIPDSLPLIPDTKVLRSKSPSRQTVKAKGPQGYQQVVDHLLRTWVFENGGKYNLGSIEGRVLSKYTRLYGPEKTMALIELFWTDCDEWTRENIGRNFRGLQHEHAKLMDNPKLKMLERKYSPSHAPPEISLKLKSSADAIQITKQIE